jgi:hypothetical protein
MSYDLTLFRPAPGTDVEAAFNQLMAENESECENLDEWLKRPLRDEERVSMQQLADRLRSSWPAFIQFQAASPLPWIELNDENAQVQVRINERTVDITIPYFREQIDEMLRCIGCCLNLLATPGYVAWDPQLGRVVTANDLDQVRKQYRSMDRNLPTILADNARRTAKKRPWWKIW